MTAIELLNHYQEKVNNIPEMRWCVSYPEEDAVKIIPHLIDIHKKDESMNVLMGSCMKLLRGCANPKVVESIINEWKDTV